MTLTPERVNEIREMMDIKRFEKAPCYLCGYNGELYYQPSVHPCATEYHRQKETSALISDRDQWRKVATDLYNEHQRLLQSDDLLRSQLEKANTDINAVRFHLWCWYPCEGKYGDDGEMQADGIDFKRLDIATLLEKFTAKLRAYLAAKEISNLRAQLEKAEKVIEQYADEGSWSTCYTGEFRLWVGFRYPSNTGMQLARTYLAANPKEKK